MGTIRAAIIQPSIAPYRVAFYQELLRQPGLDTRIYASPRSPSGVKSVHPFDERISTSLRTQPLLGGKLYWQTQPPVQSWLNPGDVLVISGNPRYISNFPLIWKARRRCVGVVWWGHGWSPTSTSVTAAVRRAIMKLADVILLYTDREAEEYLRLGFQAEKVFATNNAIDQRSIQNAISEWNAERLSAFRKQYNLEGKKQLLFCGRLTPKTRLDIALRALRILLDSGSWEVVLAVIGDGASGEYYRDVAGQLGLGSQVVWVGEQYNERELAPWFLNAECLVYPGSIGLSILHAFGYGLPVVTHNNILKHGPEIAALEPDQNGILFEMDNPVHLAQSLRALLNDEKRLCLMRSNAKKTIEGKFNIETMVERFTAAVKTASECGLGRRQ